LLDVLWADHQAYLLQLLQRSFDVARVPENDGIDDKTQRPRLVLPSFTVELAQFTALAVEDGTGKTMTAFTAVELNQDAAAIGFVVNVSQQKRVLAMRPSSAMARTRVEVRLPLWIVRIHSEALSAPSLSEPATRSMSSHLLVIRSVFSRWRASPLRTP